MSAAIVGAFVLGAVVGFVASAIADNICERHLGPARRDPMPDWPGPPPRRPHNMLLPPIPVGQTRHPACVCDGRAPRCRICVHAENLQG